MQSERRILAQAHGISRSYSGRSEPALHECSLTIRQSEIIAIVGHNGAGKSTLLDILGCLTRPTTGAITLRIPQPDVGWCPQREIIDWSLTVRQNIALGLDLRRAISSRHRNSSAEAVAELLALTPYLDKTAECLSGGELRRTQIARALVGEPRLLIMDEPTAGLDPRGIETVFHYLEKRRREGVTSLISTHETSRFADFCTRVVALDRGVIIADTSAAAFVAAGDDSGDLWPAYERLRSRSADK
ncbi:MULTISPECIES: ABC transporter ATP-binding protein [unclassified Frondihabitans]|uniref:ABC transporter ATP-binding protein n=1 Tax=unclassified Frondihabitans TaxID=2626248 RepID=UPI000FAE5C82|nr:lipopolysaccharide export system ATP-binding protein/lipooligosaccharide transport system ATP-binding protein/multidrug/hemolysin transport system ATP-binding protein [Frondihabitans sp. PhB153]RPF07695.1 lipopolysaccharide export system ATP-binding protein/lipooligosaccharide transport system ATP-binding protein/multidrug/hemolysin transport system ATP-binding protein [Frondihabitans sp. PhB161]